MQKQIRLRLADGVHLTCLQSDRYKTAVLSVGFALPLQRDNTLAALTPQVLHRGTAAHPDLNALGQALDGLYGARMYPYVRKIGDAVVIGTLADVIDERCVPAGERLSARLAALLHAVWYAPCQTQDGLLRADYTAAEGANLADKIAAQQNDPRAYALRRLQEIQCAGEPYGCNEYGSEAAASAAASDALTAFWHDTVEHAPLELFYCGSLSPAQAAECFAPFARQSVRRAMPSTQAHAPQAVRDVIEARSVTQGKLSLGFCTGLTGRDAQYPALMLMSMIFGGYTGSRLFVNVREKRSLCYYASAGLDKYKGIMMVASGIENENFEITKNEIVHQLDEIRRDGVTAAELDGARRTLIGQLRAVSDAPAALEYFFQSQTVGGLDFDLDMLLERLAHVTAAEVQQAAQGVTLDAVYFMKGAAK